MRVRFWGLSIIVIYGMISSVFSGCIEENKQGMECSSIKSSMLQASLG